MTLALTPARLAAAYDFLRAFPPFCNWGLPPASEVVFKVLATRNFYGHYARTLKRDGPLKHYISVSEGRVGHAGTLLATMAHEMLHLRQELVESTTPHADHNAAFQRAANAICRRFGFDPRAF